MKQKIMFRIISVLIGMCISVAAEAKTDECGRIPVAWLDFKQTDISFGSKTAAIGLDSTEKYVKTPKDFGWMMGPRTYQPEMIDSANSFTLMCRFSPNGQTFTSNRAICAVNGKIYGGPIILINGNPNDGYTITLGKHVNCNLELEIGMLRISPERAKRYITCYFVVNERYNAEAYINGLKVGSSGSQIYSGRNGFLSFGKFGAFGTDAPATGVVIDELRYYSFPMNQVQIQEYQKFEK